VSLLTPVWNYVDALVHPAAKAHALTAARHRAFIAPRLIGSLLALAGVPVYLVLRGVPSLVELAVFGWLLAPIMLAYFLSRTAQYESAHVLSSALLTAFVFTVAWHTGGITSFAAVWLVMVPVEAAFSASRRVVFIATGLALIAGGSLALLTTPGHAGALTALAIILAALYCAGLALGAEALTRTSAWLLNVEGNRYRLLAGNMTDVIARYTSNGSVLFISPAAETLFNVRASELMGHGLFDRVHIADRPAYLTALADAAAQSEPLEFRIRRGEGEGPYFIWVEMRCQAADQGAGEGSREVVAVLRDISERKTHEQAMEIAQREQERANAAKSRFLATMSHELRTPLNAIIGFSDMLADDTIVVEPARQKEYARLINDSGRHLLAVVNGILDVSRMETGNFEITPEPFAPAQAIVNCCDLLALKAREAGVDIKTRIAPHLPELTADRRAFNQILINLIANAIKFTPRDGRIIISAHCEGAKLVLGVEDTGVGIGEDDLRRVGEAFFQARGSYDRRHDGTGLGLSIVKGLVRLHDGEVDIVSRLGNGTRVTVALPLDAEPRSAQPVKLIADRAKELPVFADVKTQIKKSA
jgi:cell cycle sensor histidine kinase DivJ